MLHEKAATVRSILGSRPKNDTTTAHPYHDRPMRAGYPAMEQLADAQFSKIHARKAEREAQRWSALIPRLERLTPIADDARVVVVGCGPAPESIRCLRALGYRVAGVEPVPSFARRAEEYLGSVGSVHIGAAESIPLEDGSQDVVLLESVLEHVESPSRSLEEAHRVLAPGGLVYVSTTNRHYLGLPDNGEFTVPWFGKLPQLVKESYVFQHLHYEPELARFTERPAVHWFSYAELCGLGRNAGFYQFYAPLDLRRPGDTVPSNPLMRVAVERMLGTIQRNPWLRSLALTQVGSTIIMLKRDAPARQTAGSPAQD